MSEIGEKYHDLAFSIVKSSVFSAICYPKHPFSFKKAVLRMKIYKGRHTKIPAYGQSPPIGWAVNARRLGIHCP